MKVLVVGDVHGCYYTLRQLVEENWNPESEFLIQLGDLINKGANTGLCLKYWLELENRYPYQVFLLKGNHEQHFINHLHDKQKQPLFQKTLDNIRQAGLDTTKIHVWLNSKPLKWENPDILISHAGVNKVSKTPFTTTNPRGVLYNRSPLKMMDKVQVIGHTVIKGHKPVFSPRENAWRIDTGAWTKKYLSALKLSYRGEVEEIIQVLRNGKD